MFDIKSREFGTHMFRLDQDNVRVLLPHKLPQVGRSHPGVVVHEGTGRVYRPLQLLHLNRTQRERNSNVSIGHNCPQELGTTAARIP
jgi:hypothetical protein